MCLINGVKSGDVRVYQIGSTVGCPGGLGALAYRGKWRRWAVSWTAPPPRGPSISKNLQKLKLVNYTITQSSFKLNKKSFYPENDDNREAN